MTYVGAAGRIVGSTVPDKKGGTVAGGEVRVVVVNSLDGSYNSASRLEAEDEAV